MRLNPCPGRSSAILCALALLSSGAGAAGPLDALSNQDAGNGLKAALEAGSATVVAKLGIENGFLNNDKVKIKLSGILEQAKPLLKMTGAASNRTTWWWR